MIFDQFQECGCRGQAGPFPGGRKLEIGPYRGPKMRFSPVFPMQPLDSIRIVVSGPIESAGLPQQLNNRPAGPGRAQSP
jgi:hypothetical protein